MAVLPPKAKALQENQRKALQIHVCNALQEEYCLEKTVRL